MYIVLMDDVFEHTLFPFPLYEDMRQRAAHTQDYYQVIPLPFLHLFVQDGARGLGWHEPPLSFILALCRRGCENKMTTCPMLIPP